jgi:hypothetical protein
MNEPSVSPAPPVAQALQGLRGNAPEHTPPFPPEAAQIQGEPTSAARVKPAPRTMAKPAHRTPAESSPKTKAKAKAKAAPKTQAQPGPAQVTHPTPQINPEVSQPRAGTDAVPSSEPRQPPGGPSVSVGSALDALRSAAVSAQTRLADLEALPELPAQREVSDLGPYVEHVMREAQVAAAAYRKEADRETTARSAKLLAAATASAEKIRHDADAYGERTRAEADALLAERLHRIAELTGRLSQMAQLAAEEFEGDQTLRDQMMQFIAGLTVTAEEAVTDLFPSTAAVARTPHRSNDAPSPRNGQP